MVSNFVVLLGYLPPWVSTNLKSNTSWKLVVRCWLASWVAFLLILPHKSLTALGNVAFFCCITSFIVPPFLPVQVFFFAMAIMLLGCLLGWALGAAAMGAALAARDQVLLQSAIQKAQQSAAGRANPDALFRLQVFQGKFLDARSSVVFGVFLGIGTFFFALVRAYNPKLALFSLFGTIFLDVICCYGPLFPASQFFILNSFFISTASYVAIGCAVILLVFPETVNHQYLNDISSMFTTIRELVEIQEKVLRVTGPGDIKPESALAAQVQAMVSDIIGKMHTLDTQSEMLGLEFTFGRFNGNDAKEITEPLKHVVSRIAGLQTFSKTLAGENVVETGINTPQSLVLEHGILPILGAATAELRVACTQGMLAAEHLMVDVNRRRWRLTPIEHEPLDAHLAELRRALNDFQQRRRLEVVESFSGTRSYHPLFMAFNFQSNIVWCAEAIIDLLEVVSNLDTRRRRARLWAPKGLRMLWHVVRSRHESDMQALGEDEDPEASKENQLPYRRDPDSNPPSYVFQHVGDAFYRGYKWSSTPKAIYGFKYVIVSIALWMPIVFPRTAYFAYVNKVIWALILAQTTLEPYVADQVYSYVARITGTSAGVVIGLVAWYIGSGSGNGNPYGIAAVMAALFLPLMFWRLFTPSPMPAAMCSTTVVLVVGYSWLDSHLEILGSPGVGWPVAWRRWLLVVIGASASSLLMLIPPKSGRHAVRLGHAGLIFEISQLYEKLVSQWITAMDMTTSPASIAQDVSPPNLRSEKEGANTDPAPNKDVERSPPRPDFPGWATEFRLEISGVWAKAQSLRVNTQTAKWEGNLRGAWPVELYFELLEVETEMIANLAQLASALLHLHPQWRMRLMRRTTVLNPNFITDVITVFVLVSQSLRTGEPLHETLPNNLVDRIFYHSTLLPVEDPDHTDKNGRGDQVEYSSEQLRSEEFMAYATGVSAVFQILKLLDRLHGITKTLCGEIPLKGFQEWRETFEQRTHGPR